MAGNDVEGLRYGAIDTPEKYWLDWKEHVATSRTRSTGRCSSSARKERLPRADPRLHRLRRRASRRSAATTSTSASRPRRRASPSARAASSGTPRARGKCLTMVWLAKWIREHQTGRARPDHHRPHRARRADREGLQRRQRGDLPHHERRRPARTLNTATQWLICSLIHKFGGRTTRRRDEAERRLHRRAERKHPAGLHGQGQPLRLRRRVPPHPVRQDARRDEGSSCRARCSSASPARRC